MNKAYNATSSRGYEPLTDEQKDSMTDTEIDKWEQKIKDSLLRRDDTLSTLTSSMRTTLSDIVVVNGKKYSLSSFGIGSVSYIENGQLHINGDTDDSLVSSSENDLMDALNKDPDTVMKVFNELTGKLYSTMTDDMKSTSLRSALTFYNDKDMAKTLTDYQGDLKKMNDKLNDMEDRYYKQFSAMESAMAKMNSQSNSLASMLGTK
jgi:flagellar hook-associated protein 2